MLELTLQSLATLFSWQGFILMVVGVILGILIGALPGIGPTVGVALMIPFTYGMSPGLAIVFLVAIYMASEYGGSISAILISSPGTAASITTVIDGYALTQKGYPGKALSASLISSTIGGIMSTVIMFLLALPLANFAIKFGPAEYFALGVFGLSLVASLSGDNVVKGLLMAIAGLMIAFIGTDPITGVPRFTFGVVNLFEGISLIPALLGLYALSEVFNMVETSFQQSAQFKKKVSKALLNLQEFKKILPVTLQGGIIGTIIGIIPGAGGSIASWIAYDQSRRIAPDKEDYGKGALCGVAAPESANNAVVGGALVPLLTLGIPGSPTTAVLVGAFMLHGTMPGKELFEKDIGMFYVIALGLLATCILMFVIGHFATNLWVNLIKIPNNIIAPTVFVLSVIGAYSVRNLMFDVYLAFTLGLVGYVLKKYHFPIAPIVLALVLGEMMESNLRRALLVSRGSWEIFFTSPISLVLLVLAFITFFWPLYRNFRDRKRQSA